VLSVDSISLCILNWVAYTAGMKITELETSKNWQATAEDANGHQVAIVRAESGEFYLYDGNWTATAYPSSIQYPEGRPTHSTHAIKAMFDSGKLKLLKGSIPSSLVSPNVTQIGLDDLEK